MKKPATTILLVGILLFFVGVALLFRSAHTGGEPFSNFSLAVFLLGFGLILLSGLIPVIRHCIRLRLGW